jgi:hypothetical protein
MGADVGAETKAVIARVRISVENPFQEDSEHQNQEGQL